MKAKKSLIACLATSAGLLTFGQAHADITVGLVQSLTGPASSLGIPVRNAVLLWPKTIGNEKIKVVIMDDASDPTTGAKAAQRLVTDDHVDVIIGPTATPVGPMVAQVAAPASTPEIATTPADVPANTEHWFFRLPQSSDVAAYALIDHMKKHGVKTLGFLGYADAYGQQYLKSINKMADAAAIKVIDVERFERSDTSVTAQILKLNSLNPDAIMVVASGSVAGMPQNALIERGYKGLIYQTAAAVTPDFLRIAGKHTQNTFLVTGPAVLGSELPENNRSRASSMAFVQSYENAYGPNTRSQLAGHGFDSYTVLNKAVPIALKKAKPGTAEFRAALRDALEEMGSTVLAHGVIHWTSTDHWGYPNDTEIVVKVVDGQFKVAQ